MQPLAAGSVILQESPLERLFIILSWVETRTACWQEVLAAGKERRAEDCCGSKNGPGKHERRQLLTCVVQYPSTAPGQWLGVRSKAQSLQW
jgi:hypothetical protein